MRSLSVYGLILAVCASSAFAQDPYPGLTIISLRTINDSYIIDMDLQVVKTWHGADAPAEFAYMMPDSSLLRPCKHVESDFPTTHGGRIQKIDADDVVLVTGGAKGITARCALALARETHATMVLAGSSPMPDADAASAGPVRRPSAAVRVASERNGRLIQDLLRSRAGYVLARGHHVYVSVASTPSSSRETGSVTAPFAEMLPPPKLVLVGSEPRWLDRSMSSSDGEGESSITGSLIRRSWHIESTRLERRADRAKGNSVPVCE